MFDGLHYYFYLKDTDEVVKCDSHQHRQALAKKHGSCQHVKEDFLRLKCGNTVRVSTICLPFDHNYFTGKPLIFETMIFSDIKEYDCKERRASTLDEARIIHNDWINEIKGKEGVNES